LLRVYDAEPYGSKNRRSRRDASGPREKNGASAPRAGGFFTLGPLASRAVEVRVDGGAAEVRSRFARLRRAGRGAVRDPELSADDEEAPSTCRGGQERGVGGARHGGPRAGRRLRRVHRRCWPRALDQRRNGGGDRAARRSPPRTGRVGAALAHRRGRPRLLHRRRRRPRPRAVGHRRLARRYDAFRPRARLRLVASAGADGGRTRPSLFGLGRRPRPRAVGERRHGTRHATGAGHRARPALVEPAPAHFIRLPRLVCGQ
jgi:hypothetical protein